MSFAAVLAIATVFLVAAAPALAAPANDNFADAQVANTGDTNPTPGSNVDATKELGEPAHAGKEGGASVWYRWTAPATGEATVDTCDSTFDTLLGVYTGESVDGLTEVGKSDDNCIVGFGSFVVFQAQEGQVYRIAVDGFDGEIGAFDLYGSFPSLTVYTGSSVRSLTQVPDNGGSCSITFTATPGITYRIVAEDHGSGGSFRLDS